MALEKVCVEILKIINPGEFFVKEAPTSCMSEEATEFKHLTREIQAYVEDDRFPAIHITNPGKGQICLGRRVTEYNVWYRVRVNFVTKTTNGPQAICCLLDYAKDGEMIPLNCLRDIPKQFLQLPFQAKRCKLHGIQPCSLGISLTDTDLELKMQKSNKWDMSAATFIKSYMADVVSTDIEVITKDSDGCYYVRLYAHLVSGERVCINDLLVSQKYASYRDHQQAVATSSSSLDLNAGVRTVKRYSKRGFKVTVKLDSSIPDLVSDSDAESSSGAMEKRGDAMNSPPSEPPRLSQLNGSCHIYRNKPRNDVSPPLTPEHSIRPGYISQRDSQSNTNGYSQLKTLQSSGDSQLMGGSNAVVGGRGCLVTQILDRSPARSKGYDVTGSMKPSPLGDTSTPRSKGHDVIGSVNHSAVGDTSTPRSKGDDVTGSVNCTPVGDTSTPRSKGYDVTGSVNCTPVGTNMDNMPMGRGHMISQLMKVSPHRFNHLPPPAPSPGMGRGAPLPGLERGATSPCLEGGATSPGMGRGASSPGMGRGALLSKLAKEFRSTASSPGGDSQLLIHSQAVTAHLTPPCVSPEHLPSAIAMPSPILQKPSSLSPSIKPDDFNVVEKSVSFSDHEEILRFPRNPLEDITSCKRNSFLQGFAKANMGFSKSAIQNGTMTICPEDYDVKVYGVASVGFISKARDADFAEYIKQILDTENIKKCTTLQMYAWPLLTRGFNLVGVSRKQGGKTLCYITSVLSALRQTSSYEKLPVGCGPYALIVVGKTSSLFNVNSFIEKFKRGDRTWRIMILFSGMEEDAEIDLVNGCEVLISTPHAILRMLQRSVTNLVRLGHLILDDLDILLDEFPEQVSSLMSIYHQTMRDRPDDIPAPQQIVAMCKQWTAPVEAFIQKHFPDDTVVTMVIASQLEAAMAAHVKHVAYVSLDEQRSDQLMDHVMGPLQEAAHKILVFVSCGMIAETINQILKSVGAFSLCAHDDMPAAPIEEVLRNWNSNHRKDSMPVLVCTDNFIVNYGHRVDDATCVIHYDVPNNRNALHKRLWCMRKQWKSPAELFQLGENYSGCLSYWYMTNTNCACANDVAKLLAQSGSNVPAQVSRMIEQHEEGREKNKRNRLCYRLKSFGYCVSERTCTMRHRIFHNLDFPGQNSRYIQVPMQGQIKIKITHVTHASGYFARMLDVTDSMGTVAILSEPYTELIMGMAIHYSTPGNRVVCEFAEVDSLYGFEDTQHVFNRVSLLKIFETERGLEQKCHVLFVDIGLEKTIPLSGLLVLPKNLIAIPYQAVEIYICRVKPRDGEDEWPCLLNGKIAEQIQNEELVGNIVLSLGCTLWLDPLIKRTKLDYLEMISNCFDVRSLLLEDRKAEENVEHMKLLYELCNGRIDIPHIGVIQYTPRLANTMRGLVMNTRTREFPETEKFEEIKITAVESPNLFYIQLHADAENILQLQWDIGDYVKMNEINAEPTYAVSTLVLARFPSDNLWYRGKIAEVQENDIYDVFFVDFGDSEEISLDNLLPMPGRFQTTPFYAIECCLNGVEPMMGGEWQDGAGDLIYELSRQRAGSDEPRILVAKVVSKAAARHSGKYLYSIEIVDTVQEYDVNLAYQLVIHHHAKLDSTKIQVLLPWLSELNPKTPSEIVHRNCIKMLESQDDKALEDCAKSVHQTILFHLEQREEVLSDVLCVMCIVLQCSRNPVILEPIINALAHLVNDSHKLCDILLDMNGLNFLLHILDTTTEAGDLIQHIYWAMTQFVFEPRCVMEMKILGLMRISADILRKKQASSDKLVLDLMAELFTEISSSDLKELENSGLLEVVTDRLKHGDSPVIHSCLKLLENISNAHSNARDKIRKKGGLKAICERLGVWLEPKVRTAAIWTLKSLANNNRFNKDLMNELKIKTHLQQYAEDTTLSQEVRTHASELNHRLKSLLPSEKARSPQKGNTSEENFSSKDDINGLNVGDIRPIRREDIRNKPLPPKFCSDSVALKSAKPEVKWTQDKWNILLTVDIKNVKTKDVAQFTRDTVTFRAVSESVEYTFNFHLYEMIVPAECQVGLNHGSVLVGLRKMSRGIWPRIPKNKQKLPFLSVDMEKYCDSSEEEEESDELDQEGKKVVPAPPLSLAKRNTMKIFGHFPRTNISTRIRNMDGVPPELVLENISEDESEDSFEEYMQPQDANNKYGYFNL